MSEHAAQPNMKDRIKMLLPCWMLGPARRLKSRAAAWWRAVRRLITGRGRLKDGWPRARREFDAFWSDPDIVSWYDEKSRFLLDKVVMGVIAKRPRRLLDVGCGSGRFLKLAADEWPGDPTVEITGVDFSASALALAGAAVPKGRFVHGEAESLDFPDNYFDAMVCIETLEHIPKPTRALWEMMRVLAPEGTLVLTVPDGDKDTTACHINFWNKHQLEDFLTPCGNVAIHVHEGQTLVALVQKPIKAKAPA